MEIKNLILRFKNKIMGTNQPKRHVDVKPEDMTLRDAFTAYIWDCRKNKTFAEPTIDSYEVMRDKHLQFIIDLRLFDLDEHLVQVALNNELAKGYSPNTVRKYKAVLLRIFEKYRPEFKPELVVAKK